MEKFLKIATIILISEFAVFGFALAQTQTYSNQDPSQSQQTINQESSTLQITQPQSPGTTQPSSTSQTNTTQTNVTPQQDSAPSTKENISNQSTDSQINVTIGELPEIPYFIEAGVVIILAFVGWLWWMKSKKGRTLPAEDDGTTKNDGIKEKKVCPTCGGIGKVKDKKTETVSCGHCKKTGRETCHYCGGTGHYGVGLTIPQTEEEVEALMECDWCKGTGFVKPSLPCCICKGARKITWDVPYEKTCLTCNGSGYV